ncbi:MAG: TonB C-terminal domain-containing protein [Holosporales bacterium]|nr:TonB C-terminal domain-containing protein [Holosporales bacterium]
MQQSLWLSVALHAVFLLIVFVGIPSRSRVVPDTFNLEVIKRTDLEEIQKKAAELSPDSKEEKPLETKHSFQTEPPVKKNSSAVPDAKVSPKTNKDLEKVLDNVVKEENLNKQFDNMLRNVEKNTSKKKAAKTVENRTVDDVLGSIDSSSSEGVDGVSALSATEEEAIRQQIYPNWFVPAGIKDAENIIVEIEVRLSETGEVLSAKILDKKKCMSQQSTRVAAESAKRAVMLSSPIKVPASLKGALKNFVLRFNPKDVLDR